MRELLKAKANVDRILGNENRTGNTEKEQAQLPSMEQLRLKTALKSLRWHYPNQVLRVEVCILPLSLLHKLPNIEL